LTRPRYCYANAYECGSAEQDFRTGDARWEEYGRKLRQLLIGSRRVRAKARTLVEQRLRRAKDLSCFYATCAENLIWAKG